MIRTVEAVVEENGEVRLLESLQLPESRRALVMILEEPPLQANEASILSESALSDWNRSEEDAAWSHLQEARECAFRSRTARKRMTVIDHGLEPTREEILTEIRRLHRPRKFEEMLGPTPEPGDKEDLEDFLSFLNAHRGGVRTPDDEE